MRTRGFTLIELIIVIVIVSIMAIVVIPRFMGAEVSKVTNAARRLATDLRYAQSLSMTREEEYAVRIRMMNNDYAVLDPEGNEVDDPMKPGGRLLLDFDEPPFTGVRITSIVVEGMLRPGVMVVFGTLGEPKVDGSLTNQEVIITLNLKTVTRTVSISPTTGKVSIR